MAAKGEKACVVGSGPNGLAAAVVLAQAGLAVEVFEAEAQFGGACRTMELTLPGFRHDFGSAVHPMAVASPFLRSLPLEEHGLKWIDSPAPLAHPLDDGTAVTLERTMDDAVAALGRDGRAWRRYVSPVVDHWDALAPEVLGPIRIPPRHPFLMAGFGMRALPSADLVARLWFREERTRALFAGLAAHSFLAMHEPISAAVGLMLGGVAHVAGWPIPRGGSQAIANALRAYLESLGGKVTTGRRIESLDELSEFGLKVCDVTPRQLVKMAGGKLQPGDRQSLSRYRYGPGVFKVDYALSGPIPWTASDCARAITVHLGGAYADVAASERAAREGRHTERPFVLLAQQSLFDESRAPDGKHTVWAYCHVPNGSTVDMTDAIERQIERFAPGFRDLVLARRTLSPATLESMDANLVGGDVNGGLLDYRQFLFRPTRRLYETSAPDVFLCSSSTPPGGGVHGMCGYWAAHRAIESLR